MYVGRGRGGSGLFVWIIGDAGIGGATPARVRDAYLAFAGGLSPDLWLMLGDNAYTSGTDAEYQVGVFDVYDTPLRSSVLWPTLGNHDGISADSATQSGPYYDIFSLPAAGEAGGIASSTEAYYSFDYGRIHFVCLDSYETSRAPDGPMLQWLAGDLHAAHADWTVAFWHHPPYSKGSHNSDVDIELTEMRQNVLPVLESAGVDLVLCGHSHGYERSVLLDGHYGLSTTLEAAMVRDGGDGRVEGDGPYHKASTGAAPHEGAVYAVVGSSARTGGGPLNHPAMRTSLNELGSLLLDVDGPVLTGRFLDDLGRVRDGFTLTKGAVSTATLQGTIRYYHGNQAVGGAALTHSAASDAAGHYSVTAPIGAPLALMPRRAASGGAVSALDAAWVLQAVAGPRPLDATQTLIGDVTGDGIVSTLGCERDPAPLGRAQPGAAGGGAVRLGVSLHSGRRRQRPAAEWRRVPTGRDRLRAGERRGDRAGLRRGGDRRRHRQLAPVTVCVIRGRRLRGRRTS